jgi:23S rRNA (guanosine2251-2'-O)-methyltransferase
MAKYKKFHHKARSRGQKKSVWDNEEPEGPSSANSPNLLYGKHAVLSALANPQRQIRRLILTLELNEGLLGKVEQALSTGGHSNIEVLNLDRQKIEGLLPPGAVHQGIALETDALKKHNLEDIINQTTEDAKATIIILDQATDTQNIGAILRSTAAFGGAAVIIQDRNSPVSNGKMAKAASGALEHVALVRTTNLVRAMDKLKAAEYWCVGLEGQATKTLAEAKLSGRVVLVLGAEGVGLRRLIRENCDLLVRVPVSSKVESLNLSNAAAIALYEKTRN